jgi:hypothetical protein
MRSRNRGIAQWVVTVFLTLVVGAITTVSAQDQSADLPELPLPDTLTYKTAQLVAGQSVPAFLSGLNPAIHSFGHIDLTTEGLGLRISNPTADDSHDAIIDLPDSPGSGDGNSPSMVSPAPRPAPETKVQWKAAIQESLFLTGIAHTFNLATEAGTRDALNGPWLNDYLHSVGELRGWSDSDRFMAPYASHPIQGSAFGFIERQNDPRYRKVQWGDGREYFMSLLHSMAYAAIWHTQWKIGPASEASIGNVMLHASPGFICLVDTPTLGTIALMAEDIADRYVVTGIENRSTNRLLIVLARGFLSPGRSVAQATAFHYPWRRENRLSLTGEDYQLRKELVAEFKAGGEKPFEYVKPQGPVFEKEYPKEADIELEAFPVYEHFLGAHNTNNCVGGGGSGASRVNPYFQLVSEVSGCLIMGMPAGNESGDMLFWGGGGRWTPLAAHRVSPYLQTMFGGRRVTHEILNAELRKQLLEEWGDGNGTLSHYPKRSDYSVEVAKIGPALSFGSGFDWVVTRAFAWRMVNVEYSHAWMQNVDFIQPQRSLRITTGAVLRIGTW